MAVNRSAIRHQLELLKDMGCNASAGVKPAVLTIDVR